MGDTRRCNRRSFKFTSIDPKDGEKIYTVVKFKFKNKSFARPIILEGKQAQSWFINRWKEMGWKEGDNW